MSTLSWVAILALMEARAPSSVRRTLGARTGGRSERVVAAVIRATIDAIATTGYAGLRVELVAERAGVNKTSVYRRWPTKADLVAAAMQSFAGHHEPLPDTGSVRSDLIAMAHRAIAVASTPEGRAFVRIIAVESGDPDVDKLGRKLRESMMAHRAGIIERAQRRGELPHGIDARVLLDAIFVPILTRVSRFTEEVDPTTPEAFVDLALAGAQHGAARTHKEAC